MENLRNITEYLTSGYHYFDIFSFNKGGEDYLKKSRVSLKVSDIMCNIYWYLYFDSVHQNQKYKEQYVKITLYKA